MIISIVIKIGSAANKIATFFNMFESSNVGFAINQMLEIKLSRKKAKSILQWASI